MIYGGIIPGSENETINNDILDNIVKISIIICNVNEKDILYITMINIDINILANKLYKKK